ncbi:Hypothetical protein, predicted transmembrane protein [Mycoplasma yeatsii 13926]|uniref:Transmembrane protein n=1 Tax=Mycoplasma yeatsii 13926 TaxID=1188240 RepID=S6G3L3_9MOLU|nr:aromatic motif membrane protein [Mycoplasma yeatsii]EOA07306.1 Hypothetical protein, predicted transmembrane protein [Mycoplasma yeatsii 13926]
MNKTVKKIIYSIAGILIFALPFSLIFTNKNNIDLDALKISKEKQKEDRWNRFIEHGYVNEILKLEFKDLENSEEEKNKYVNEQKQIVLGLNKKFYLNKIKSDLSYVNNFIVKYGEGDEPFTKSEFGNILNRLFKQNWLSTLFNLDKFIFFAYDDDNQFAKIDSQENALKYGTFRKLKTNEISQYAVWDRSKTERLNTWEVYILTSDYSVLKIDIKDKNVTGKNERNEVSIFNYAFLYPELSKDKFKADKFILRDYVEVQAIHTANNKSPNKDAFNEQFGGSPHRYVIIDVDSKTDDN